MSLRIRRGGTTPGDIVTPPPPSSGYGPTNGRASVIAAAVPQIITDPGGGLRIAAGSSKAQIQTIINNAATSALIVVEAGTYAITSTLTLAAKRPTMVFLPGAIFDGGNGNFNGITNTSGEPATIRGGKFQHFGPATGATSASPAAIDMDGTVEDAEFTLNNTGLYMGHQSTARRVWTHHNYRYGMTSWRQAGADSRVVEYCKINNNNTAHYTPWADASGTKFLGDFQLSNNIDVRYNYCHDNYGFGLWFDFPGWEADCYENVCEGNLFSGIIYEAPYSGAGGSSIYRNYVAGNGDRAAAQEAWRVVTGQTGTRTNWIAQILITDSDGSQPNSTGVGYEVYLNQVDTNATGSWPIHVSDGGHPDHTTRVHVHDNETWLRATTARVGGTDFSTAGNTLYTATYDNTWTNNLYHVTDMAFAYWRWGTAGQSDGTTPGPAADIYGTAKTLTWAQWQAKGFDVGGTRDLI